MKGLVTPSLPFSHLSTMFSTISMHKSVFSLVLNDSFMYTKGTVEDPIDIPENTEDPDPSVSYTTSIPMLFYQSPQDWPGPTRATLVKYIQNQHGVVAMPTCPTSLISGDNDQSFGAP